MTPFDTDTTDGCFPPLGRCGGGWTSTDRWTPPFCGDCVQLASYAPNASNAQDWRWVIVTDPDPGRHRRALRAGIVPAHAGALGTASGRRGRRRRRHSEAVLYLAERFHEVPRPGDPLHPGPARPRPRSCWTASLFGSISPRCGASSSPCTAGAWPPPSPPPLAGRRRGAELLGIPDDYLQMCLIPVAYLLGDDLKPPDRRGSDEIIAWNTWA